VRLRGSLTGRLGIVGAITALGLAAAAPAYAAIPANDTIGGATAIDSLPYDATQDTSEATTDAVDLEANRSCGLFGATPASVWYSVTPTSDTGLSVNLQQSSYAAAVIVLTGAPGNLAFVTCGNGAVFAADAGVTYYLPVFHDDVSGNGGLWFSTSERQPRHPRST